MSEPTNPWILAARPATLPAAAAPVVVASALAASAGVFRLDGFLVTLFAALMIQVGVNYANDLADAEHGADTGARIGPTRAVAAGLLSPAAMRRGTAAAFGAAALAGTYLVWLGGWVILVIGVLSILAALAYTAGPFPYGYHGLGEVFVFLFFGLAATAGTHWVYDRSAPAPVWWAGVVMGLLAAAILVANNVRDLETDRAAGKRTLAVLLGPRGGRWLYATLLLGAFLAIPVAVLTGTFGRWMLLALAAVPYGVLLALTLFRETAGPPLVAVLKGTARIQLVVALLLAAGALAGRPPVG